MSSWPACRLKLLVVFVVMRFRLYGGLEGTPPGGAPFIPIRPHSSPGDIPMCPHFLVVIAGDSRHSQSSDTRVATAALGCVLPRRRCQGCARSVPRGTPSPLLSVNYESKRVNNDDPMGYSRSIPDEMQNDHNHHNSLGSKSVFPL